MLWPPPLIESCKPLSRTKPTVRATSSVLKGRTTSAGRFVIIPFQMLTASSQPASPG